MEPEMRPCPACGDVYYMFPGEPCSAECAVSLVPGNPEPTEGTQA